MMRRLLHLAVVWALLAAGGPALALGVDPPLPDPRQEARAVELHKALRCLVCQNQSIHDSNASLATDLRQVVRERIVAGDTDAQVIDYVVFRYGDWVLLKPPFKASTVALWASPGILILLGFATVRVFHRRNRAAAGRAAPAQLDADERRRLRALLEGDAP